MGSAKVSPMDPDFVAEKSRASVSPTGNIELLLCVGMCIAIVSAYVLLKREQPHWTLIAAAVIGCFIAAVVVGYAIIVGTVGPKRKISTKHSELERKVPAKHNENENAVVTGLARTLMENAYYNSSSGESVLETAVEEDQEHSKDCVSCMPDCTSEAIPGRYAGIVGAADVRSEYGIESYNTGKGPASEKNLAVKSGLQEKAALSSHAPGKSDHKSGNGKWIDGSVYKVHGEIRVFHDHIICSMDKGAAGPLDHLIRELNSGNVFFASDSANGKIILRAGGRCVDKYMFTTHSNGDSFPEFDSGVHVVYRVKFPVGFKLLGRSDVLVVNTGSISNDEEGRTSATKSMFCKVNVMLNYDSLVKLMFSEESQSSGDMQRLFLLYLGFYYEGLKDCIEIEQSYAGDVITIKGGFEEEYLGAVFANDIKNNKSDFDDAIAKCNGLGEHAAKLCNFAQAVQGKIPNNFVVPDTKQSKMLSSVMGCIYAVTCSQNKYFSTNLSNVMKRVLWFTFFSSKPLREALVLQAISDEAWYIKKNESKDQSILSGMIKNLKESTSVLLDILLKPNGHHKDRMKEVYNDNVRGVGKDIVAALLLAKEPGIDVDGVKDSTIGSDDKEYRERLEHYEARGYLCQNPAIDLKYGHKLEDALEKVESLVPYAVVDTVIGLNKSHGTEIVFAEKTDIEKYVRDLSKLKSDRIVDFLGPRKSIAVGRDWFEKIMKVEVEEMVSPQEVRATAIVCPQSQGQALSPVPEEEGESIGSALDNVMAKPHGGGVALHSGVA